MEYNFQIDLMDFSFVRNFELLIQILFIYGDTCNSYSFVYKIHSYI